MEPFFSPLVDRLIAAAVAAIFLGCLGVILFVRSARAARTRAELAKQAELKRAPHNPIVSPDTHAWELGGTFNPAAARAEGQTHLFYRAIGLDGVSRVGYAKSANGDHIDERLPFPVFALERPPRPDPKRPGRHPGLLASGGSWAGAEDPRAVILDDRLYLSFSAFAGWDSVRIGVSSISLDNLNAKRWRWTEPVFLSEPKGVAKNWVIFPERINGKVAVLHSLNVPDKPDEVAIDYLATIDEPPEEYIKSPFQPRSNPERWDSSLRGAATPPVRTDRGWLLLYHAMSAGESHRYKLGAMLLDLDDPTKIIARSQGPILAPDACYENEGAKSGVVYACGATVEDGILRVYYGAADSWSCVAHAPLAELLDALV
jgi:predicted GH43/DUF377 family glycosyl hydrolase